MPHTSHLIAATTITPRDLRIASVALLTQGEMPVNLSKVPPSAPLTNSRLAKRFLRHAAETILAQTCLWQGQNIDAAFIAEKFYRVPTKEACDIYGCLLQTSEATCEHLLSICAKDPEIEILT